MPVNPQRLSAEEAAYVRQNNLCFKYAMGVCNREQCRFGHVKLEDIKNKAGGSTSAGKLPTATTTGFSGGAAPSGSVAKACAAANEMVDRSQRMTVRCPSFQLHGLCIEIDTGCSNSIISEKAANVFRSAGLALGTKPSSKSFTLAAGDAIIHAYQEISVLLNLHDRDGAVYGFFWQPCVVKELTDDCDGLLGRECLSFSDSGLDISLIEGPMNLSRFWCSVDELKNGNDDSVQHDFSSPPHNDLSEDEKEEGRKIEETLTPPKLEGATFLPPPDPTVAVVYRGDWLQITVNEKADKQKYFCADISCELADWMSQVKTKPAAKVHWKWL
ncbi:hypothetical protein FOZ63_011750, partial [Perkinsus olseni]